MNKLQNEMQQDLASVEKTEEKRQEWFEKFYQELVKLNFIPAGRVIIWCRCRNRRDIF